MCRDQLRVQEGLLGRAGPFGESSRKLGRDIEEELFCRGLSEELVTSRKSWSEWRVQLSVKEGPLGRAGLWGGIGKERWGTWRILRLRSLG